MSSFYNFSVKNIDGKEESLSKFKGKVLLIVNVASKCGFTPQYKDLQTLYQKYQAKGLEILAFPCNQFGAQEPGDEAEIKNFCSLNYDVSFPLFSKIEVNGKDTHPLYAYLKEMAPGLLGSQTIKWNFTKFLVSKDGAKIERYAPQENPLKLAQAIEELLK
jgi:glutathione peroxidase